MLQRHPHTAPAGHGPRASASDTARTQILEQHHPRGPSAASTCGTCTPQRSSNAATCRKGPMSSRPAVRPSRCASRHPTPRPGSSGENWRRRKPVPAEDPKLQLRAEPVLINSMRASLPVIEGACLNRGLLGHYNGGPHDCFPAPARAAGRSALSVRRCLRGGREMTAALRHAAT